MNRYSVIAIILAILSGVFIGVSFISNKSDKDIEAIQKKLDEKNDSLIDQIHRRDKEILTLEDSRKLDSVKIHELLYQIIQDRLVTDKKRLEAKQFTPNEKRNYLLNRYK